MGGISELVKLAGGRVQGPSPGFDVEHVFLAFLTLGASRAMGRQKLAAAAGTGEGSMRTILRKLKDAGYVDADPVGISLTAPGKKAYAALLETLTPPLALGRTTLTLGKAQAAVLARSSAGALTSGIAQRDASVKAGAEGTTSYLYRANRFAIPGGSTDCEKDFPSGAWQTLREAMHPRNGDAVVVCGASDETTAKLGALAAALTLL